jgi:hypothetical protein
MARWRKLLRITPRKKIFVQSFRLITVKFRASTIGFLCGLLLCTGVNYFDYQGTYSEPWCFDCFLSFGVPFKMWGTGGFVGITKFHWGGLIANIFVWIVFSFGLSYIGQAITGRLSRAISSQQ